MQDDHFSVLCEPNADGEIEVLTPFGAAVLSGRTQGAVTKAVRERRVKAPVTLMFLGKEVRLVELASAMDYWKAADHRFHERTVAELRHFSFVIEYDGWRYRVLHGMPPIFTDNYGVDRYGVADEATGNSLIPNAAGIN